MVGVAKVLLLTSFAAGVSGARIATDQLVASKDGEMCVVSGPEGSGLSAAVATAKGKCFVKCRNSALAQIENERLFQTAFEATPQAGDKCACTISSAVSLVGGEGKISWEVSKNKLDGFEDCSQAKCWKTYKGAYDVGRKFKMMLDRVGNYKFKCSPDDGSLQGGTFTMGISVFHHVKVQATKQPQEEQVTVAERLEEELDEDDTPELMVEDSTTLEEVLDHKFARGATSDDNIKKAAEIIKTEVNVVEDPWKGWAYYLAAIGKACNVGISDLEALQKVQGWEMDPSKMFNENVCQADVKTCYDTLSEYPGLQSDGCDDDECEDAIDKIQRFFVSFGYCKAIK